MNGCGYFYYNRSTGKSYAVKNVKLDYNWAENTSPYRDGCWFASCKNDSVKQSYLVFENSDGSWTKHLKIEVCNTHISLAINLSTLKQGGQVTTCSTCKGMGVSTKICKHGFTSSHKYCTHNKTSEHTL